MGNRYAPFPSNRPFPDDGMLEEERVQEQLERQLNGIHEDERNAARRALAEEKAAELRKKIKDLGHTPVA